MNRWIFIAALLLPLVSGILLPLLKLKNRNLKKAYILFTLAAEAAIVIALSALGMDKFVLFSMTDKLSVSFAHDGPAALFAVIAAVGWLLVGIYSLVYTSHMQHEDLFYAFFLLSEAAVIGMDFSSNLISMYFMFELVTLCSMPLVLQERSKESIRAALKYLYYSIAGAFLALGGIFMLYANCDTMEFVVGGSLKAGAASNDLLLVAIFIAVLGFGAKAGLYPLHGWLPTAHPVAPAPASAVLSGIIAKAGVLGIFRLIYYVVGADFLRGTWVQYALISVALATVFIGSMMAFTEDNFKKRLAYSTVSQVSYVLTGLFMLTADGVAGGLMHVMFHASIKVCLFLAAGAIIHCTGKTKVSELKGIGRQMPITTLAFTFASLSLIGIPPFSGFVSKWYLASGSLSSGAGILGWLAPAVLLISALLTAGYLLPVTISGFFPGKDYKPQPRIKEGGAMMWAPVAILALFTLLSGIFSSGFAEWALFAASAIV